MRATRPIQLSQQNSKGQAGEKISIETRMSILTNFGKCGSLRLDLPVVI